MVWDNGTGGTVIVYVDVTTTRALESPGEVAVVSARVIVRHSLVRINSAHVQASGAKITLV